MPDLALSLLVIGRSPVSGRVRNPAALDKALRAALFVELILDGRIGTVAGAPHVLTAEPMDDAILAAVSKAVAARPAVVWRRWYRHVAADRAVLTKTLVEDGRWRADRDRLGRRMHHDDKQAGALVLSQTIQQVGDLREQPADREQAVLALLSILSGAIAGRPRPRELRRRPGALLDAVGPPSDPIRRDVEAALRGGAAAIRHRPRILP